MSEAPRKPRELMWRSGDLYYVNLNTEGTFATVYPDGKVENNKGLPLSETSMLTITALLLMFGREDLAKKLYQ